jgi:hypothetical protein
MDHSGSRIRLRLGFSDGHLIAAMVWHGMFGSTAVGFVMTAALRRSEGTNRTGKKRRMLPCASYLEYCPLSGPLYTRLELHFNSKQSATQSGV